jgi:uncharacterized protein with HEPN domain
MSSGDRTVLLRLQDILRAITGIQDTVSGHTYQTYGAVWSTKHARERGIEIISEASRYIPDDLKATEPNIPWRQIAGIGNVFRHEYETISDRVAWDIIENHLDPLAGAIRRLKARIESEGHPTRKSS